MAKKTIKSSLAIFDYTRKKICDLYESQTNIAGQAYNITFGTNMRDGIKELNFTIPYMVDHEKNFRWAYLKSEYLVRLIYGDSTEWYVLQKPKKDKKGKEIIGTVTCSGLESTLKTKNIYKEFDDENGIGTIDYLVDQILAGTGWHRGYTDPMLEADGETEKIRSLKSGSKQGALGLMSSVCNLFRCYPVYKTDTKEVELYNYNNREQVLEGEVGRNLETLSVEYNSNDIITRLYVEGEYGDDGYVGIDSVNPTGLSYIFNFDYYRELGLFTQEHEDALSTYLTDIRIVKDQISANMERINEVENEINNLIGQCKLTVYYTSSGFINPVYVYGEPTTVQKMLNPGDKVVVLNTDGTYRYDTIVSSPEGIIHYGDYCVAKFATPAAGTIGAGEVQIEAKEKEIANLQRKINSTTKQDKIAEYNAEIATLRADIQTIYTQEDGLYDQMDSLMKSNGLLYHLDDYMDTHAALLYNQDIIESTFIAAMGDMLRDGYSNNQNYIEGQEQHLYDDSVEAMEQMSKPTVSYSFNYIRVAEEFDVQMEDIHLNAIFKIHDNELDVHDNLFVSEITIGVDDESNGSIEVSNKDITLNTNSLGALLSRMSQLSDLVEQKNTLYNRSQAISKNGTLYTDRLNGQIDVLKNQILSSVSNWYTDEHGNILFLSADGGSAMMLSGAGFMISNSKDNNGNWVWRTFGSGDGFTADEIVAGFISADRIEAGSIATGKLAPNVGSTLVITGNPSITALNDTIAPAFVENQAYSKGEYVNYDGVFYIFTDDYAGGTFADAPVTRTSVSTQLEMLPDEIIQYVGQQGYAKTVIQLEDPLLDPDSDITYGDYWIQSPPENVWAYLKTKKWRYFLQFTWDIISGYYKIFCYNGSQWIQTSKTSQIATAFSRIDQNKYAIEQEVYRASEAEGELQTLIIQKADEIYIGATRYIDEHAYAVQSGIDIVPEGIDIYGAKYLKLRSGASMILEGSDIVMNASSSMTLHGSNMTFAGSSIVMNSTSSMALSGASVSITSNGSLTLDSDYCFIYSSTREIGTRADIESAPGSERYRANVEFNDGDILVARMIYDSSEQIWSRSQSFYIGTKREFGSEEVSYNQQYTQILFDGYAVSNSMATISYFMFYFPKQNGNATTNFHSSYLRLGRGNNRYTYDSENDSFTVHDVNYRNTADGTICVISPGNINDCWLLGTESRPFAFAYVCKYYGKTTSIYSFSSREYKRDIVELGDMGEQIDALKPISFRYKTGRGDQLFYGLIYEDTVDVMPVICHADGETKSIGYGDLVPVLLKEVQQLRKRVKELEEKQNEDDNETSA